MTHVEPAELAPGDRVVVNGNLYAITSAPRREPDGLWVDVDLGGMGLPVRYDPHCPVEVERSQEVGA